MGIWDWISFVIFLGIVVNKAMNLKIETVKSQSGRWPRYEHIFCFVVKGKDTAKLQVVKGRVGPILQK